MKLYTDALNPFGFAGQYGYGVGQHGPKDFLSSENFGEIVEISNKISNLFFYPRFSLEGHVSCFYGNLAIRKVDSTIACFINPDFPAYGINLPFDSSSPEYLPEIYNETLGVFQIPVLDDLYVSTINPCVRLEIKTTDSIYAKYRPSLYSFDYTSGKIINFKLINILDNTYLSTAEINNFDDHSLYIQIFGTKTIPSEIL